jgi:uncharacterized protein DUF29
MSDLYDSDTARWAEEQAELLRRMGKGERVNDLVDWANVAEEIEDVAKRDRDRIYGQLVTALTHLLKWQHQPEMRSGAWRSAVVKARDRIAKLVKDSPSLRGYPALALPQAYPDARRAAEAETGLSDLPTNCPWTVEQVLDRDFWPEA